ncbi:MAG: tetratricopeptide repeat protein, partial [Prevotella sp.]
MDLVQLIKHPERMDKETLYDLRSLIALHPYYQTARLLMLQNLYILHDPTFDEELRKAAIYITDRKVIFNLVEAAHYKLRNPPTARQGAPNAKER